MVEMKSSGMKSFGSVAMIVIAFVALLLLGGCTPLPAPSADERGRYSEPSMYETLDPYGAWVNHPRLGEVWRPDVESEWAPFQYGDWVWSDQGWVWSSYEPFGWLVYHYGNWYHDPDFGWFWVPGDTWSPAPVAWTAYGDYVGWCPQAPAGAYLPNPWDGGGLNYWNIVETNNFAQENVGQYRLRSLPPRTVELMRPEHKAPDVKIIDRKLNKPLVPVKVVREATSVGKKTYYRTVMPEAEKQRAERYQSKVTRKAPQSGSVIAPQTKKADTSSVSRPEERAKDKKVKSDDKKSDDDKNNDPDKDKNGDDTTKVIRRPDSRLPH
jgi:hypothetical protein